LGGVLHSAPSVTDVDEGKILHIFMSDENGSISRLSYNNGFSEFEKIEGEIGLQSTLGLLLKSYTSVSDK
jgi:hypothetical protein